MGDTVPPSETGSSKTKSEPTAGGSNLLLIVAAVVVVLYFGLLIYLLSEVYTDDKTWARELQLLGGFEAIAFTAAGYLFGREVNRKRADNAEERAGDAEKRAEEAKAEAATQTAKGKALAAAVETKAANRTPTPGVGGGGALEQLGPGTATNIADPSLQELADLSRRLFP